MNETGKRIPHKLWILWFQGLSEAPFIVKKCIESWIRENPTWDIVILDNENLNNYIHVDLGDRAFASLSQNHRSNVIRLALLSEHGGIWADATTYCIQPLDEWIDDATQSGFFAFHRPGPDRIMANWFLASEQKCPLIEKLYRKYSLYWKKNTFPSPNRFQNLANRLLTKILCRNEKTTRFWFSPIVTKLLKITPYFGFHYIFERLVATDAESRTIWNNTKKISAVPAHTINKTGFFSIPTQEIKTLIDSKKIPMFKLTWKYDHANYSSNSLLYFLLQKKEGSR